MDAAKAVGGGVLAGLAALALVTGCTGHPVATAGRHASGSSGSGPAGGPPAGGSDGTSASSSPVAGGQWPSTGATAAENTKQGSSGWFLSRPAASDVIAGWADHVSVTPGQRVRLFVSTIRSSYTVTAYRMGYYGGADGHRVWASNELPGRRQPAPHFLAATRTVTADDWRASLSVHTGGWVPGDYLFVLQTSTGEQNRIPLTVRGPSARGAVVILNAVTTWNAYNLYGGSDLYAGPDGAYGTRSDAVSFDRPYAYGEGAADLPSNELPLVALAERLHLPLDYVTDVDVAADPHLLDGARAVISLGHDEYWSAGMRRAVTVARDAGTNIAFLGANAIYRHIRLAPTPIGPDRLQIDYKTDATADPADHTDPPAATFDWRAGPDPRPESVLTGDYYQCNGVLADMVAADPSSWLLTDTGLTRGDRLPGLVGNEYDRVDLTAPTPRPIEMIFHSPLTCHGHPDHADVTYYTTPSGAGVFDTGTSAWVCALGDPGRCGPGRSNATAHHLITDITTTLLRAFAAGPAGRAHPAHDNTRAFYPPTTR